MDQEHYVCLGDCEGVSDKTGVCQAPSCITFGQPLSPCNCTDGKHSKMETNQKTELADPK